MSPAAPLPRRSSERMAACSPPARWRSARCPTTPGRGVRPPWIRSRSLRPRRRARPRSWPRPPAASISSVRPSKGRSRAVSPRPAPDHRQREARWSVVGQRRSSSALAAETAETAETGDSQPFDVKCGCVTCPRRVAGAGQRTGLTDGGVIPPGAVVRCRPVLLRLRHGRHVATPPSLRCADTRAAGRVGETARCSGCRAYLTISPADAEMTGAGREWTVAMISELSMPCR
jgi:hypothetical protein